MMKTHDIFTFHSRFGHQFKILTEGMCILSVIGCFNGIVTIRDYEGAMRRSADVARVYVVRDAALGAVDGKETKTLPGYERVQNMDDDIILELTPGDHTLSICLNSWYSRRSCKSVTFTFHAGHTDTATVSVVFFQDKPKEWWNPITRRVERWDPITRRVERWNPVVSDRHP